MGGGHLDARLVLVFEYTLAFIVVVVDIVKDRLANEVLGREKGGVSSLADDPSARQDRDLIKTYKAVNLVEDLETHRLASQASLVCGANKRDMIGSKVRGFCVLGGDEEKGN